MSNDTLSALNRYAAIDAAKGSANVLGAAVWATVILTAVGPTLSLARAIITTVVFAAPHLVFAVKQFVSAYRLRRAVTAVENATAASVAARAGWLR